MKIYASSEIPISKFIGKDRWVLSWIEKETCRYTAWVRIPTSEIVTYFGQQYYLANIIYDVSADFSGYETNSKVLDIIPCDTEVVQPLQVFTTEELVEYLNNYA